MRTVVFAAMATGVLLLSGGAFADDKTKVQPGTGPTESVTEAVPDMKSKCPDEPGAITGSITPGTDATGKVGSEVPPMKPGDQATASKADCPETAKGSGG